LPTQAQRLARIWKLGWGELLGAGSNLPARDELLAWPGLALSQAFHFCCPIYGIHFPHTGYLQLMALCWDEFTLSGFSNAANRKGQFLPEAI